MEEDRVKDEFASFKRRLESRPGKDDERNDAVKEGEAKSDTSEASDSSSEGAGEVIMLVVILVVGQSSVQLRSSYTTTLPEGVKVLTQSSVQAGIKRGA